MTIFAYLALFGWIPAVMVMFATMPGRQAATIAVIGAWLLLPPYNLDIGGLPDYSKNTAATFGIMLVRRYLGHSSLFDVPPSLVRSTYALILPHRPRLFAYERARIL